MRWSAVPPAQWNEACGDAMPLPGSARPRPAALEPVMARIIQPGNENSGEWGDGVLSASTPGRGARRPPT
ncbi:hypothetical protein [Actinomyces oricola]|uniref:hypothetical protein n=1 Tax=Actinomyces oricola TaxID=206043 RepID=UPI000FFF47C2|nr:hypothetical protein [Actinomyces oricola]